MKKHSLIFIFGLIVLLIESFPIFEKSYRRNYIVYSIHTHQKVVALTFDDGPHPIYTGQLLDILSKYHVKATFFMIGSSIKRYPFIAKQVITKGHSIGNHTYTHPFNMADCSNSQIVKELNDCESMIKQVTGQQTSIFRPPRGFFNNTVVRIVQENKYFMVLWSACGNNSKKKNPESMAKQVIQNIHAGDIILLHDGTFDSRWRDVEATQLIIEALLKKGYHFVTVPQLLGLSE